MIFRSSKRISDSRSRSPFSTVIGHVKEHRRIGRNHLAHASGDAINALLAAAFRT